MFSDLDSIINCALNTNNKNINDSLISKIHDEINVYYNSVNIFVGKQGSGKTLSAIKEIIKISQVCPITHLLVYITKTGNKIDPTFESLKQLINIPIEYVKEDEAEQYMKSLLAYKQLYKTIINDGLEDEIIDEQRDEIFDVLHVNDFNNENLHTLILLEDIANNKKLLGNEKSYFNHLMTTCRHNHLSFFLNVQFWKSLSSTIKSNVSTVFIFGTFSKQQLHYILYQIPLNIAFDELYNMYHKLTKNEKIIVDCNVGSVSLGS